jgi:hypothetical protein
MKETNVHDARKYNIDMKMTVTKLYFGWEDVAFRVTKLKDRAGKTSTRHDQFRPFYIRVKGIPESIYDGAP